MMKDALPSPAMAWNSYGFSEFGSANSGSWTD
jgi:hypothetical protein